MRVQHVTGADVDDIGDWTSRDLEKGELLVYPRASVVLPMPRAMACSRSHYAAPSFQVSEESGNERVRDHLHLSFHSRSFEQQAKLHFQ